MVLKQLNPQHPYFLISNIFHLYTCTFVYMEYVYVYTVCVSLMLRVSCARCSIWPAFEWGWVQDPRLFAVHSDYPGKKTLALTHTHLSPRRVNETAWHLTLFFYLSVWALSRFLSSIWPCWLLSDSWLLILITQREFTARLSRFAAPLLARENSFVCCPSMW